MDALLDEMEEMKRVVNKGITAEQKARLRAGLKAMENTADPIHKKEAEHYVLPRPLRIGDSVLIYDIDKKAIVVELSEKGEFSGRSGRDHPDACATGKSEAAEAGKDSDS